MGFLSKLFGSTQPAKPDLDQLFAIPGAAITLETVAGFKPKGVGTVAFRAAEGGAFASTEGEIQALLDMDDGPKVERVVDSYGFTWLIVRHDPLDSGGLVTDLHAVNTTLEGQGFGPLLLCSIVWFTNDSGSGPPKQLGLVYLYKRGTFYPFAPGAAEPGKEWRDNALELQIRGLLANDLKIETDLARWFPVWGAPG
jgi:hypothetical protein